MKYQPYYLPIAKVFRYFVVRKRTKAKSYEISDWNTNFNDYDRGTYLQLEELPFPVATNEQELINRIKEFNLSNYQKNLIKFNKEIICSYEKGKASEAVYNWMQKNKN